MKNFRLLLILSIVLIQLTLWTPAKENAARSSILSPPIGVSCSDDNTVTYDLFPASATTEKAIIPLRQSRGLEPGFPVNAIHTAGNFHGGQAIHTLIMNLDDDPELEIIVTGQATGPIYAWNHDGTLVPGWPVSGGGLGYAAGGPLLPENEPGLVVACWGGGLTVYNSGGFIAPGWPIAPANYISTPPSIGYLTESVMAGIFLGEEDWSLHGYYANGQVMPGWPVSGTGGQERHTPAIEDIDHDGEIEIITCSGSSTPGVFLHACNADGTTLPGFPVNIEPNGYGCVDAFPAIGDIDNDEQLEIIVANKHEVRIFDPSGLLEIAIPYQGTVHYSTAVALGDFDGDDVPEIVVQTNDWLNILKGDGSTLPGWPVALGGSFWMGNSGPVIGDVDGDGNQDILITLQVAGSSTMGEVHAYDATGSLCPSFPITLPIGSGAVPAIADLDLDERNEIIITGSYWNGTTGNFPKCWVYDLEGSNYGPIAWGQFMHDAAHTGSLPRADYSTTNDSDLSLPLAEPGLLLWPNPARSGIEIKLLRPRKTRSAAETIKIYGPGGNLIRTFKMTNHLIWDGRDHFGNRVAAGMYFIQAGELMDRAILVR